MPRAFSRLRTTTMSHRRGQNHYAVTSSWLGCRMQRPEAGLGGSEGSVGLVGFSGLAAGSGSGPGGPLVAEHAGAGAGAGRMDV